MRHVREAWTNFSLVLAAALILLPACGSDDPSEARAPLGALENNPPAGLELSAETEGTELGEVTSFADSDESDVDVTAPGPAGLEVSRRVRLTAAPVTATSEIDAAVARTPPTLEPAAIDPTRRAPTPTDAPPATDTPPTTDTPPPAADPDLTAHAERPATIALQHIDVRGEIVGNVAEIEVEQVYENTLNERLEAVYVFPLPENAAVRDMIMVIGERRIRADLMQREAARETYEAAREQGRTTSLLEQERPNIFTMSVANIEPGEPIRVLVRYVEQLRYADGRYHFNFPTVVGPRFIPGEPTGREGEGALPDTDLVPDASRITPAVLPEGEPTPYTISFAVDLFAGMPIQELASASVEFDAAWATEHAVRVALPPEGRQPNRDLAFTFALAGDEPATGMLSQFDERGGFFSLMVEPPSTLEASDVRPKEIVFVIDMSGSMRGQPLDAAKGVIRRAVADLNPDDTFQILRFSETASGFAPRAVPNTPANVAAGLSFVDGLSGTGGTQMIEGIRAALQPDPDPERLRVVLFLTDGFIGNESAILAEIERLVGDARLFALGVGSSPNRFLLDKMAEVGRGTVHYIDIGEEPTQAVDAFYRRVRNPVLTDLTIDWGGLEVSELTPEPLPDVFEGTPLLVSGRYATPGEGTIAVRGRLGREPIELLLDVTLAGEDEYPAVPYLWARRRIDGLERQASWAQSDELQREIIALSLEYRVLTQYTAYVAVDERISADATDPLHTVATPVALPENMSGAAIGPQMIDARGTREGVEQAVRAQGYGAGRGGSANTGSAERRSPSPAVASAGPTVAGPSRLRERSVTPRPSSPSRAEESERSAAAEPADVGLSFVDVAGVVGAQQERLLACTAAVERTGERALRLLIWVNPDGSVERVEVRDGDDLDETVRTCLTERVGGLRFASFSGSRSLRFEYHLRLPAQ